MYYIIIFFFLCHALITLLNNYRKIELINLSLSPQLLLYIQKVSQKLIRYKEMQSYYIEWCNKPRFGEEIIRELIDEMMHTCRRRLRKKNLFLRRRSSLKFSAKHPSMWGRSRVILARRNFREGSKTRFNVSIHALHMEGDNKCQSYCYGDCVSIHALHMEGDNS